MMEEPEAEAPPRLAVKPREPVWGYEDLGILVALALPCLAVASLAAVPAVVIRGRAAAETAGALLPVQFAFYLLFFSCLGLLLRWRYRAPFWRSLAWRISLQTLPSAVLGGMLLAAVIGWLGVALRTPEIDSTIARLLEDPVSMAFTALFATTVAPLCEEMLFRGFLLPLLARSAGTAFAIIGSALPFGLLHGAQYLWTWQHLVLVTLAGCIFGVVRVRTGSTAVAACMHSGYNFTLFLALGVQKLYGQ